MEFSFGERKDVCRIIVPVEINIKYVRTCLYVVGNVGYGEREKRNLIVQIYFVGVPVFVFE